MSTTTTALGTVPQLIVDAVAADFTEAYTTQVQFDTHGAEFIGLQMTYVKGAEAGVRVHAQAKLIADGTWVSLPLLTTAVVTTDTANASRAIQLYVGREVNEIRIQALRTTATPGNGTTSLKIWGMLSAPTLPIVGGTFS